MTTSQQIPSPNEMSDETAMPGEFYDLLHELRSIGFVLVDHGPWRDGDHWQASLTLEAVRDD